MLGNINTIGEILMRNDLSKEQMKALDPSNYNVQEWYCLQRELKGNPCPVMDVFPHIDIMDIGWVATDAMIEILNIHEKNLDDKNFKKVKQKALDKYNWRFENTAQVIYEDFTLTVTSVVDAIQYCECVKLQISKGKKSVKLMYDNSKFTFDNAEELKMEMVLALDDAIFEVSGGRK